MRDRKTARILTGSPFSVNTAKGGFPLECRSIKASKELQHTFGPAHAAIYNAPALIRGKISATNKQIP
ncbi:hypothetical protein P4233_20005, partial [Pseudomonas aeruginosa]|nr:hypothetical protein [Pseudomonas aeruginosa]